MNVTNDMAEAALDALDDACIGFNRSNPRASVHWKGFTRDDRVAAMRTALSAALAKQDAAIALMRGQSWQRIDEFTPRNRAFLVWGKGMGTWIASMRDNGDWDDGDFHDSIRGLTHYSEIPESPKDDPADEQ